MVICEGKQKRGYRVLRHLFIWIERPVHAEGKDAMEEEYFRGKKAYTMAQYINMRKSLFSVF